MTPIHYEGLVFRSYTLDDAPAYLAAVLESVEIVGRWMPWCHKGYSLGEAVQWFADCDASRAAETAFEFGIFEEESGVFLGGAGLNQICWQNSFCNLGYWVRQTQQRKGIASRSVRALADHAFRVVGLQRVEIVVALGNDASEGVARKCAALEEGVARNRLIVGGVSVPARMFSLVPESNCPRLT
jgi:ribosomal-protein-serine acetyltransferase